MTFTLVHGVRKKIVIESYLGVTTCSNCGHHVRTVIAREGGYHHINYIPVLPYHGKRFVACPNCGIMKLLN